MSLSSSSATRAKTFAIIFLGFLPTLILCFALWMMSESSRTNTDPVTTTVVTTVTTPVAVCPEEMDCPPMPSLDY